MPEPIDTACKMYVEQEPQIRRTEHNKNIAS
jgi:hypothetical protein